MTNKTNNLKLVRDDGDEPFDPRLDALLNEALAPEAIAGGIPADLASRVFEATRGKLRRRRTILGRIGPGSWSAMAASWIIAGGLAMALSTVTNANPFSALKGELRALNSYQGPSAEIDQELASLAVQIEHANSAGEAPGSMNDPDISLNFATDNSDAAMIF